MIKIVIPDVVPSRNEFDKLHWGKKAKIIRQWNHDIYYTSYSQRPSEPFTKAKVRIKIYFPTVRRRDNENYMQKFLCDGLKQAKIIIDDRTEVIGTPEIILGYDKENSRTEIEVIREAG